MALLLMAAGSGSRYGKLKPFDGLGPKETFFDGIRYSHFPKALFHTQKESFYSIPHDEETSRIWTKNSDHSKNLRSYLLDQL